MLQPLMLGSQSYVSRSAYVQSQRLINMYVEVLPKDSPYPFLLVTRHGLTEILDFESNSKIRGMREFNGNLYVVVGADLYKVIENFTYIIVNPVVKITEDNNPVMMEDNAFQLAILTESGLYYVMDIDDNLTEPVLDFFPTSLTYAYQSMIASAVSSQNIALIRTGDLSDAETFDPAIVTSASEASDLIVRLFAYNNLLYVMKQGSIEYFSITEDATQPFQQVPSSTKTFIGLAGVFAITSSDNYIFWLGSDRKIYKAQSYDFTPISTPAIDFIIDGFEVVSDCYAFSFTEAGHKFVVFDFLSGGYSFVYDVESKLWHERKSYGSNRWNVRCPVKFLGKNLFADSENSKIYEASQYSFSDGDNFIEREVHTPPIGDGTKRNFFKRLQLNVERGVGDLSGDFTDPKVMLQYTDDGGRTYSNEVWQPLGQIGQYEGRSVWTRQGASRSRIYKLRITAKVKVIITGFYGDIVQGEF